VTALNIDQHPSEQGYQAKVGSRGTS
jgi:hypothetical protein